MRLNDWIEANHRLALKEYPQFRAVAPPRGTLYAWEGAIKPFPDSRGLGPIIQHLKSRERVFITSGTLTHDASCTVSHPAPGFLYQLVGICRAVQIRVVLAQPGMPPRAFVRNPFVGPSMFFSTELRPPHTYADGAACAYFPSTDPLPSDDNMLLCFLDYVSIWTAKFLIWRHTGIFGRARWIGPDVDHDPLSLLASVLPSAPCPCGKPRHYGGCCRPGHKRLRRTIAEAINGVAPNRPQGEAQ